MSARKLSLCVAALAQATLLLSAPAAFSQSEPPPDGQEAPSGPAHQAIEWSRERLVELDAVVAELEKHVTQLKEKSRAKADAAIANLKATAEAYRTKAKEVTEKSRAWTQAEIEAANKELNDRWNEFEAETDAYLTEIDADLKVRQAVLKQKLDAQQAAWQRSINELQSRASALASDQRAKIEARIEAIRAQADEAGKRLARLNQARRESWDAAKRGLADAQKVFSDTYQSIKKSIEDATK